MVLKIFGRIENGEHEYNIDEKIKWIKRAKWNN